MKKLFSLTLIFALFLGSQTVSAQRGIPTGSFVPEESENAGAPAISETFDVNKHLKAPEQNTFVPSKDGQTDGRTAGATRVLVNTIDLLVKIIASLALVVFILGALLTVSSEGKEDRLEKGKTAMLYALIGLVIAFFSFIAVAFVQSIFF